MAELLAQLIEADDAERRAIERELHDGLQQRLVSLAVTVQLARRAAPDELDGLLDELGEEVRSALDQVRRLVQRIRVPDVEAGGVGAALRVAAGQAGVPTRIEGSLDDVGDRVATAVFACCVELLRAAADGVSIELGGIGFSVTGLFPAEVPGLARAQARLEVLGGGLKRADLPDGRARFSGSYSASAR